MSLPLYKKKKMSSAAIVAKCIENIVDRASAKWRNLFRDKRKVVSTDDNGWKAKRRKRRMSREETGNNCKMGGEVKEKSRRPITRNT